MNEALTREEEDVALQLHYLGTTVNQVTAVIGRREAALVPRSITTLNEAFLRFRQSIPPVNEATFPNRLRRRTVQQFLDMPPIRFTNRTGEDLRTFVQAFILAKQQFDAFRLPSGMMRSIQTARRRSFRQENAANLQEAVNQPEYRLLERRCATCAGRDHLSVCSRCRGEYYCSRECQRADWQRHRVRCTDYRPHPPPPPSVVPPPRRNRPPSGAAAEPEEPEDP